MNDFEDRFKRLVSEHVDAELGGRREPPAFRPSDRGRVVHLAAWRRRPWMLPLLAAACVVLIVGGTAGAVDLLADDKQPVATDHPSQVIDPTRTGVDSLPSASATRPTRPAPTTSASSTTNTSVTTTTNPAPATTTEVAPSTDASTSDTRSSEASSSSAPPSTTQAVVRPVHADGTPAAGYRVHLEKHDGFTCGSEASPVAVDADIVWCGSSADNTLACWKSTNATVLCLRDATTKVLVRIPLTGRFTSVSAPKHPRPQILTLGSSAACTVRNGGAGDNPADHPSWIIDYFCGRAAVYGPLPGDGIDRSTSAWTVHYYQSGAASAGTKKTVTTAYFVGTAR